MAKKSPYKLETISCPVLNEYIDLPEAVAGLSQLSKGGRLLDCDGRVILTKDIDIVWQDDVLVAKIDEARKAL